MAVETWQIVPGLFPHPPKGQVVFCIELLQLSAQRKVAELIRQGLISLQGAEAEGTFCEWSETCSPLEPLPMER
jgi:hypothetical protein